MPDASVGPALAVYGGVRRVLRASCAVLAVASACIPAPTAAEQEPQATPVSATGDAVPQNRDALPSGPPRPWIVMPVVASNPKLGTAFGALGAYIRVFDPASQVSLFGANFQYTSTDSIVGTVFARTSFGADHHRLIGIAALGYIKNDYQDYLGTGQPLKTNDDLKAVAGRYVYRIKGDWLVGAQGNAANYQVLGESTEDDLILETLGVKGFRSAALGAVVMQDSRDNQDMPTRGWYLNLNNLAYREALGGDESFDAYRADARAFWPHGGRHVLAFRQYNWLTHDASAAAQATVVLRGYKLGQYLAPYMSSFEAEERLRFGRRWGATVFGGVADLYGGQTDTVSATRQYYPMGGAGIQFIIKPAQHLLANFEYAYGIEDNRGFYLKFGYAW